MRKKLLLARNFTDNSVSINHLYELSISFYFMRLEHLLRYLRALPTIRVHPELDGRLLDIVHFLTFS